MTKPDPKHPFIRDLKRGPYQDRFKHVLACSFGQHHCWSRWEFEKLHCYEHFSAIVTNRPWRRLLSIREKVYHEPVLEFYTTFKHTSTEDWTNGAAVKFRLGGAPRSMSYHELATALDLGLADGEDYVTELNDPVGVNFKMLYTRLAQPGQQRPFVAGKTKASTLQLDNRLLHHLLAKSYTPASDSANAITRRALYFIQSIRQADHPLHLGSVVARTFEKSASELKSLHCTPLITRLATYFGLSLQGCTEQGSTSVFGRDTIHRMHLLRENRGIMWIKGFPEPQIPEEEQPEDLEDEAATADDVQPEDVDDAAAPAPPPSSTGVEASLSPVRTTSLTSSSSCVSGTSSSLTSSSRTINPRLKQSIHYYQSMVLY
ncbi:unnamed protein product [Linum trigynum]|uniref:Uncharacterized protein n=1 Tax=Linum trigynum TaxID=586398 RepID=A0AAV2DUV4_9ROSI